MYVLLLNNFCNRQIWYSWITSADMFMEQCAGALQAESSEPQIQDNLLFYWAWGAEGGPGVEDWRGAKGHFWICAAPDNAGQI